MALYVVVFEYEHTQRLSCQYQECIIACNVGGIRKYNASFPIFWTKAKIL